MFQALAKTADAVLDNLRGDLPEKLGLTYEHAEGSSIRASSARTCRRTAATGSRKAWPGYDYLMQAEAGHMSLTGEPDGPPTRYGLSIVDLMTGLAAAFGLLAGVTQRARHRQRHGRRHVAVRRRAAQPQLPRHLVS